MNENDERGGERWRKGSDGNDLLVNNRDYLSLD